MGYYKTTLINIGWSGILRLLIRILTFIKLAILARILTPSDFGAVGIATLVLAFLEIFSETGINVFLIQEKKNLKKYLNTAFVVSIFRGFLISIIILAISKPVSIFFNSPSSYLLLLFVSLVPAIRGFINPSVVKYRINLEFKKEFFLQSAIFIFDAIIAITTSLITRSGEGLVLGMVAGAFLEVILTQIFIHPRPKFKFNNDRFKKVIRKGKWLTFAGIFNYLFENLDDMFVGKILGDSSLGTYQVAYKISSLPITEVSSIVNKVTLPVFVKMKDDLKRLKRAYLKSFLCILVISSIFGFVLFFYSELIITILLGEKWLVAGKIVKVLAFFGLLRSISVSTYPVFLSLKRQDIVSKITLVNTIFLLFGLLFLVGRYGIVGAGYSAIIGAIAGIFVSIYFMYIIFK